ncbi:hypothetical protein JZU46_02170 [bacterium]|jgi:hypothetical protein|nr:hypothetical protein [bacterium]
MTKVVIRTDDLDGFFARARDAARRADQGQAHCEYGHVVFGIENLITTSVCSKTETETKNGNKKRKRKRKRMVSPIQVCNDHFSLK